ncbi:tetratricopeptide repeat protein [Yunchengibacter salinarum]|uniref:tetratricopeptide repeat protein n=1 Tax=Yunchengibacter salinarum TaxID=3133399 RepID=UPI0035B5D6A9
MKPVRAWLTAFALPLAGRGWFCLLLALSVAALPVAAREGDPLSLFPFSRSDDSRWVQVETPHVRIISQVGADRTRRMARSLDAFRQYLQALFPGELSVPLSPVTVVVVDDDARFADLTGITATRGVYRTALDGTFAVVSAERRDSMFSRSGEQVLRHEYVHHFLHHRYQRTFPLWFEEGLAEFLAGFRDFDGSARFGGMNRPFWAVLREGVVSSQPVTTVNVAMPRAAPRWASFDALMTARTRELDGFRPRMGRALFYAQSWALVHHLMGNGWDDPRWRALLDRLQKGETPQAAMQASYGFGIATLDSRVRADFRRGRESRHSIGVEARITPPDLSVRTLKDGAAQEMLVKVAVLFARPGSTHLGRLARALSAAATADPRNPFPLAMLTRLLARAGALDEAATLIEGARDKLGDKLPLVRESALLTVRRQRDRWANEGADGVDSARLRRAIRDLDRVLESEPGPRHQFHAAFARAIQPPRKLADAAPLVRRAYRANPVDPDIQVLMGQVLISEGDYDAACRVLRPVAFRAATEVGRALVRRLIDGLPDPAACPMVPDGPIAGLEPEGRGG